MDTRSIRFIYFSGDNGMDYPKGGITAFTRQMIRVFGNRMAIVGISTDETEVGNWTEKEINGKTFLFFAIAKIGKEKRKPFIPQRLLGYLKLRKYKNEILKLKIKNAFVQNSHFLIALKDWDIPNKAYIFHGATNPLEKPRYAIGRVIAPFYEKMMFKRLRNYNAIFVAADDNDIQRLQHRSKNRLKDIVKLPTRFDDTLFYPQDKHEARKELNLDPEKKVLIQVGRLSKQKGGDLILQAFRFFLKTYPGSLLIFVGDGEEHQPIQEKINQSGLQDRVFITGFVPAQKVARYYHAADLVLVGSHMEGWSVAMVEALACGKNIVSTRVSGAKDMIANGKNGYIVETRAPDLFAQKMIEAIKLPVVNDVSLEKSQNYSLSTLKSDIEKYWHLDYYE